MFYIHDLFRFAGPQIELAKQELTAMLVGLDEENAISSLETELSELVTVLPKSSLSFDEVLLILPQEDRSDRLEWLKNLAATYIVLASNDALSAQSPHPVFA